ncbi:MAG: YhdP family protein [Planktomarina sp.]
MTEIPPDMPKTKRKRFMALRCAINALLTPFLAVVLLVAIAVFALQGRTVPVPKSLADVVRTHVSNEDIYVEFDAIEIGLKNGFDIRTVFTGVKMSEDISTPALQMSALDVTLDGEALLYGHMRPVNAIAEGGVVRINRLQSGKFDLGFGTDTPAVRRALSLDALFEELVQSFDIPALSVLQSIDVTGVSILYGDKRSGQSWTFDGGVIKIARSLPDNAFRMRADLALLTGQSDIATLAVSYSNAGKGTAILSADLDGVQAKDLASQIPALAWLATIDAPISGSLRDDLSPQSKAPLSARLDLGAGTITLPAANEPIIFTKAKTYLRYNAERQRLDFDLIEVQSDVFDLNGMASAVRQGDQFLFNANAQNVFVKPGPLWADGLRIRSAGVDGRISLEPIHIELGQFFAQTDSIYLAGQGRLQNTPEGWLRQLNIKTDSASYDVILKHWPKTVLKNPRRWIENNILSGAAIRPTVSIRQLGDEKIQGNVSLSFKDAAFYGLKSLPPITQAEGTFTVMADQMDVVLSAGVMAFEDDGIVDVSGTTLHVPDLRLKPAIGQFDIAVSGPLIAALSALDHKPFEVFTKMGRDYRIATGDFDGRLSLQVPFQNSIKPADVTYDLNAQVTDVQSTVLVPNRQLTAQRMQVSATHAGVTVSGAAVLDGIAANATWTQGQGVPGSNLSATFTADAKGLASFGIALPPDSVTGQTTGQIQISLPADGSPRFDMTSDLVGAKISIPQIGWSKSARRQAALSIQGQLEPLQVNAISLDAPGLKAEGTISLTGNRLDRITLSKLSVGRWLSGAVTLTGQGAGQPMAVSIAGGQLDLRNAPFANGGNGSMPPISGQLGRIRIADGLSLHNANLEFKGGKSNLGRFSGQINGGASVSGTIARKNQSTTISLQSRDAGGVMRDAGILRQANGGDLKLTLQSDPKGGWRGSADIIGARVQDAPALANLLSAISVVGILEQMDGKGLMMDEIKADFVINEGQVTLYSASAVGPSLGLSLDGYINTAAKTVDLQGVVSPLYLVNSIGAILTRRGEGLLGFNFTLKGQTDDMRVRVNPLSILTPGMFREIFRRAPPQKP